MAIDLSSVPATAPQPVTVVASDDGGPATIVDLAAAQSQSPPPQPGILAERMTETAAAGVELTKIVLGIVAGSIAILSLYLFVVDLKNGASLDRAYQSVIRQATAGTDLPEPVQLDRARKRFAQALSAPDTPISGDDERDMITIIGALNHAPTVTDLQRADLNQCVPIGGLGENREQNLRRCVDILNVLQQSGLAGNTNLEKLRLLSEFSKEVNEHRQTFRTFWIQLAQLILLNLLLPLLTALLGYIFGTTQSTRRPNGAGSG